MNALLGLEQLLEDEALTEDQLQMVHRINTAGRSLLGILNGILDFSEIEAGQLIVEKSPVKLADEGTACDDRSPSQGATPAGAGAFGGP